MRQTIWLCLVVAVLTMAVPATGQECGDVNGNSPIDVADLAYLVSYLVSSAPGPYPQMDMDDHTGVALGDLVKLTEYLFIDYPGQSFDCTPDQSYSFAPSPGDTVFIPRVTSIPDGIDSVRVIMKTSLQPGAGGVMLFLKPTPGSAGGFQYRSSRYEQGQDIIGAGNYWNYDRTLPSMVIAHRTETDVLMGSHDLFIITYARQTPGSTGADLILEENMVDQFRRICIERNGDLVVPTIAYYEHQFPPDTLKVSATALSYSTSAGKNPHDTFTVVFSSSGGQITFDLGVTQPWIQLLDMPGVSPTTPETIKVAIDGTVLPEGIYAEFINIQNVSSQLGVELPQPSIGVNVTVGPPVSYPPGDISCDGVVDLSDLSRMIAYLIRVIPAIEACP